MGAEVMRCIEMFDADAHDDETFCKQRLLSLVKRRRVPVHSLHVLLTGARVVTTWINQEAACVDRTLDIHSVLEATRNTPPQVDISTYRYVRKKTRTGAVGTWRRRTLSSLVTHSPLPISPLKNVIARSSRDLATYYGKGEDASIRLFYWAMRHHNDLVRFICFATSPICIDPLTREPVPLLLYPGLIDVQTYLCPLDIQRRMGDHRMASLVVFASLGEPISERDQKKGGKQLKPAKPPQPSKPKTRKQKSEREGDKEKQEENEPKTEGPMLWIMRKSRACIA